MKITVLNGSPKGELSVTMQYVNYLAKLYPQHQFDIVHIAQRIKRIEHDRATFDEIIAQVRSSDAVLWGFPLYYLLVHAHYKRFIDEDLITTLACRVTTGIAVASASVIHMRAQTCCIVELIRSAQ